MGETAQHPVRACLITNPRSGRGRFDLSEVLPVLHANGWMVTICEKRHGGEATALARAAADDGFDVVVGCGGDGTLSEIVDGLAGSDVAIGVLPGGTANVWAGELGISHRPRVAAFQLVMAQRRRADLGHISINGKHGRHFLLMAGIGIDGAVMQRVSKPLKHRVGRFAVAIAAVRALPALQPTAAQIEIDGVCWQGRVHQIVAGNTRRYGGFARLTPAARMYDAELDLCLLTAAGPLAACRQIGSLLLHGRPHADSAETYRAARIVVRTPGVVPLQVDGGRVSLKHIEPTADGVTYTITARPAAVTLLVPPTYDGDLFKGAGRWGNAATPREQIIGGAIESRERCGVTAEKRHRLRVTQVGTDTIVGVRRKRGQSLVVRTDLETVAKDANGTRQPLAALLSGLRAGDVVRVKGHKDPRTDTFLARRVSLCLAEESPE